MKHTLTRRTAWLQLALIASLGTGLLAPAHAHSKEDHSAHAARAAAGLARSEGRYQMPPVKVVRQDGQRLDFRQAIDDGRPVLLNFIYTSCTAICPVTSQVFSETRERLGADRDAIHVVSVSIDPDYDTRPRMAEYAQRFSSGGAWSFFSASQADSIAIQKAFKTYQGDKMNHVPVTFLRAAPGEPWIRLDGFASPSVLVTEIRTLKGAAAAQSLKTPSTLVVKTAASQ